jgi:hypothetical protein
MNFYILAMQDINTSHEDLYRQNAMDTLAWYLMATGFIALAAAGIFIFLKTINYRDYVLNGSALGRYFLIGGMIFYFAGRGISYYRRFQRRKAEKESLD